MFSAILLWQGSFQQFRGEIEIIWLLFNGVSWSHNKSTGGAQANTTARSNQAGNVTTPLLGGLRGAGLSEMDQMFTGIPDASLLNQFLQNPAISQMMQSLLSNPQYVNQV